MAADIKEINVLLPDEDTIRILSDLLDRAKAGEVVGIMVVISKRETFIDTEISGGMQARDGALGLRLLGIHFDKLLGQIYDE